jgi:hypothetical protein
MNRAGDHSDETALEMFTFDASNSHILATWSTKYEVISRANAVLINAPKVNMDETLRNRSMGEALFSERFCLLASFTYLWRSTHFDLKTDVLGPEIITNPKSPLAEVRAQAEADFQKAATLLPVSYDATESGRVTQGSAYGFLTKLYVYEENWAKAIEASTKVIGNAAYKLADNYNENFATVTTENNPEILFSLQYETGWTTDNSPTFYHTPQAFGGWGFHEPIDDLVKEFEKGDPRRSYSIYSPGDKVTDAAKQGIDDFHG